MHANAAQIWGHARVAEGSQCLMLTRIVPGVTEKMQCYNKKRLVFMLGEKEKSTHLKNGDKELPRIRQVENHRNRTTGGHRAR